ncbi:hypothetical protein SKAU_G00429800 [Synaphobranchus kaupii]|uniref:Uncharacterized protein n=1 Tax=Synaphobranchus kaupii TaxID=118154 RepID=A0A9Q1IA27_SYNKA|nr:hypothetical protein SKAU_G00429800 [Synaphobranchus kaupii]
MERRLLSLVTYTAAVILRESARHTGSTQIFTGNMVLTGERKEETSVTMVTFHQRSSSTADWTGRVSSATPAGPRARPSRLDGKTDSRGLEPKPPRSYLRETGFHSSLNTKGAPGAACSSDTTSSCGIYTLVWALLDRDVSRRD